MAALLTSVLGNMTKVAEYIAECGKMSIRVLPPDINHSNIYFHVDGNDIRFGLLALKNVGRSFSERIIRERSGKPFESFEDFVERMMGHDLNRRQVETLIKAGAFDSLGVYRSRLVSAYEKILDSYSNAGRGNLEGQLDMFSMAAVTVSRAAYEYPDIPEYSPRELLTLEKECSGMYFTGHLLDGYSKHIEATGGTPVTTLVDPEQSASFAERDRVTVTGIISEVSVKNTKNDERMAFFTLEDKYAGVECILFPKGYEKYSYLVRLESAVVVMGTISRREEEGIKILVNAVQELEDNASYQPSAKAPEQSAQAKKDGAPQAAKPAARPTKIFLRVPSMTHEAAKKAINLIGIFEAEQSGYYTLSVQFFDDQTKTYKAYSAPLDASPYVIKELKAILGDQNVVIQ